MAVLSISMPEYTGDTGADVEALRSWACRLVSELRTIFYSLDSSNVLSAASVKGSGIVGRVDAAKLIGAAEELEVNASNGVTFSSADAAGDKKPVAKIYCDSDGALHIDAGELYINGVSV